MMKMMIMMMRNEKRVVNVVMNEMNRVSLSMFIMNKNEFIGVKQEKKLVKLIDLFFLVLLVQLNSC